MAIALLLSGCGGCEEEGRRSWRLPRADAGGAAAWDGGDAASADGGGATATDAGDTRVDGGGTATDGGGETDGGHETPDGGGARDLGIDAGATAEPDAEVAPDTGPSDSGAGPDSGATSDASAPDVGAPDSGPPPGSGDVWVELDYSNAFSPQSPGWSFSATPGWGAGEWAMAGDSWPEAWDRWNNMSVVNDPIGTVLELGSSSELQLMIGLEELAGYQQAVVHLEGRSRATSSPVFFEVYNPLTGCGPTESFSMAQDWTIHAVDVDLGSCMVIGGGVQAVRVSPSSGTIALVRMRLTLLGATW